MEDYGLIHEKLDIKILILYALSRLPGPVDMDDLMMLSTSDAGVDYFEYSECLADLIDTGHISVDEDGFYLITEKGRRNSEAVATSLPSSVRMKVERLSEPVADKILRASMIKASHSLESGACTVKLSLSDPDGEMLGINLLVADEKHAKIIEKNFRRYAEDYYQEIVSLLSDTDSVK